MVNLCYFLLSFLSCFCCLIVYQVLVTRFGNFNNICCELASEILEIYRLKWLLKVSRWKLLFLEKLWIGLGVDERKLFIPRRNLVGNPRWKTGTRRLTIHQRQSSVNRSNDGNLSYLGLTHCSELGNSISSVKWWCLGAIFSIIGELVLSQNGYALLRYLWHVGYQDTLICFYYHIWALTAL